MWSYHSYWALCCLYVGSRVRSRRIRCNFWIINSVQEKGIGILFCRAFFSSSSTVTASENYSSRIPRKALYGIWKNIFILVHSCIVKCSCLLLNILLDVNILGKAYNAICCQCHCLFCSFSTLTELGMHPSHRACLHAPENTRLLWFSSHLIETGLSMPSGWVSRWIFMGDLVESVHVVLSDVHSTMMFGRLLQNTKTLLHIQICVIATSLSLLNTCEAQVFGDKWLWWFIVLRKCTISVPKSPTF